MESLLEEARVCALGGRSGAAEYSLKTSSAFSVELKTAGASGVAPLSIYLHEEQLSLLGKRKKFILREMWIGDYK